MKKPYLRYTQKNGIKLSFTSPTSFKCIKDNVTYIGSILPYKELVFKDITDRREHLRLVLVLHFFDEGKYKKYCSQYLDYLEAKIKKNNKILESSITEMINMYRNTGITRRIRV